MKILCTLILIAGCLIIAPGCSGEEAGTNTQTGTPSVTEPPEPTVMPTQPLEEKASSLLLMQIDLRQQQMESPSAERLEQMKSMGMSTEPIDIQRVFIYFTQRPNEAQVEELEGLGVMLYQDSWIPPAGNHPYGFLFASVPVDSLDDLAGKDYVERIDTAEEKFSPQNGAMPGGGEPPSEIAPATEQNQS